MTHDEALKYLKAITEAFGPNDGIELDQKTWANLHTAIKEVLANVATNDTPKEYVDEMQKQRHEQEPVALLCCGYADASAVKFNPHNQVVQCHNCGQIYITPPQRTWVGLTDEEIDECYYWKDRQWTTDELVRHVEAKLKEKNT